MFPEAPTLFSRTISAAGDFAQLVDVVARDNIGAAASGKTQQHFYRTVRVSALGLGWLAKLTAARTARCNKSGYPACPS